jgi:general secretion pathway protein E
MGRVGIYEIMAMTDRIRPLIGAGSNDLAAIREQAYRDGMKPLRISGARKVASGATTVEEVMTAAPPVLSERKQAAGRAAAQKSGDGV